MSERRNEWAIPVCKVCGKVPLPAEFPDGPYSRCGHRAEGYMDHTLVVRKAELGSRETGDQHVRELGYVHELLNEHNAPTHDERNRKLSAPGRLADFLHAESSRDEPTDEQVERAAAKLNEYDGIGLESSDGLRAIARAMLTGSLSTGGEG